MMSDGEAWANAGAIVAEHGPMTADDIIQQLEGVLGDGTTVEDWCRVAAAAEPLPALR